jgi:hypothetical protein
MSFGMRIWGADGALQMDENSFTMRVVFSEVVVSGGFTQSGPSSGMGYKQYSVPGVSTSNAIAVVIPIGTYSDTTTQFETEMLDGAVRVYNYLRGYSGTWMSSVESMRLLVIRFS